MVLLTTIKKRVSSQKGQSLIELLLAIGLAAAILPSLLTGLVASRDGREQQQQTLEAVGYLREAEEAVRVVKESWNNIPSNGTYHPVIAGTTWTMSSGSELLANRFTRSIEIENVYRDSNGAITLNPEPQSILDPSTKRIFITVSWQTPYPSSTTNTSYITRYENTAFMHTTQTVFNAGDLDGVTVQATTGTGIPDDGEVLLGAGGGGSWCDPNLSIQSLDLPKNGVANAISAIEGKAFAGTGENASGVSYASINISNSNPPAATLGGTFSGYKTNDIFGEEDYAYLATDTNQKEIVVVNLNTLEEAGYFDAPGNGDGNSVYVAGNIGFATVGNVLYTFDLSNKIGSRPVLGSISLSGTGVSIYVVENFVYVAQTGTPQLRILEVSSDGRTLTSVGQAQAAGGAGKDLFINSSATRGYLATTASSTQNEFFIIDISTKTGDRPTVGSYDTNGMDPRGITVVPGNHAIVVGIGGLEYQVINISNETTPTACGGLNIDSGVNGLSSVLEDDGDAYSYIITGDSTAEFKIIEGGPGGHLSGSGIYESPAFDASSQVTFNYFTATVTQNSLTSLTFQFAVANSLDCSTADYQFVGPDGTDNTFYTASGSVVSGTISHISSGNYQNPGRCFKYKAYFNTTDSLSSPILRDITINYSL